MLSSPPPRSTRSAVMRVRNMLWSTAALVIVVAGMRAAQSVLLPILVAVLLAIICAPAVRWLTTRHIPNGVAVMAVVGAIMALLAGLGVLVGGSVGTFRESIPAYQEKLATIIYGAFSWVSAHGVELSADRLTRVIEPASAAKKAMDLVSSSMSALATALSNTVLVVLTMILILLEGATIPGKLRALSSDPDADISNFRRIAKEVQSYLAVKTVLALATGMLVTGWATVLHVDFAVLWGLLAFLLNYIPNIGSILAAIPAMLLALVQHGLGTSLALGAGYLVVGMVVGNVIEPWWMGRKLGLSTTVVFLSLVVWGWVWGPVGMLLSVPLTMVVKIMLEGSREWSFVAKLLEAGELPGAPAADLAAPMPPPTADEPAPTTDPSPSAGSDSVPPAPQSGRRTSQPLWPEDEPE